MEGEESSLIINTLLPAAGVTNVLPLLSGDASSVLRDGEGDNDRLWFN